MMVSTEAGGRAALISALAVIGSSLFAWLTPIQGRMEFWLRGPVLTAYEELLVLALFLGGTVLAARVQSRPSSPLASAAWGIVLGYLAGLFAVLFHPLLQPDGFRLFLDSLRITSPEALIALIWFPVRLLSWLCGAMTGLFIGIFLRIIPRIGPRTPLHGT